MKPRMDLRTVGAPAGIEVYQLTTGDVSAGHIYMEAQIFTPDSRRFVLYESAAARGANPGDPPPRSRYLVCDLDDGGALRPITDERGVIAPSVSPDGRFLYYLVNETVIGGGRLTLKRVGMDGSDRQTLLVIDGPLPGTKNLRPSLIYGLSTIRSDGRRLAVGCFLGDGQDPAAPWGVMIFDLEKPSVSLPTQFDGAWANLHPQYSRSIDAERKHDLLLQHNHGVPRDARGEVIQPVDYRLIDVHVMRDDGTNLRDMPWGMDGIERCQGHQCWRGRTDWAITSTNTVIPGKGWIGGLLIESRPLPHAGHRGAATPGAVRNLLTRNYERPNFFHFATDIAGTRLVTDCLSSDQHWRGVLTARLGEPGTGALSDWTQLVTLAQRNRPESHDSHVHPFLSPDGTMAFFNSEESGMRQAYMIRGLDTLPTASASAFTGQPES